MKLTPEAAQAFTNLRGNRDFENVMKWLMEYETQETGKCVTHEGVSLHRAQGAVAALCEVRVSYADAPATLNKIINKPR